jgi:transcriptional regulator with XRE-family HTH domain
MTIAERIRLYRQQKGLTQEELAKEADLNKKSLSRYEIGTSVPPADALKRIADALEISADALLNDEQIEIRDKNLLKKFQVIQDMNGETKKMITNFLDLAIRDYEAKKVFKE